MRLKSVCLAMVSAQQQLTYLLLALHGLEHHRHSCSFSLLMHFLQSQLPYRWDGRTCMRREKEHELLPAGDRGGADNPFLASPLVCKVEPRGRQRWQGSSVQPIARIVALLVEIQEGFCHMFSGKIRAQNCLQSP